VIVDHQRYCSIDTDLDMAAADTHTMILASTQPTRTET
jgi:hypothetical protein